MKYYCIGIKGSGMSTLANILYDLGNEVSGYDDSKGYKFTMEGLNARGIEIFYDAHEIDKDTIVTYSKAFSPDHKEIKRVRELGLTIKDYNEVVGDITRMFTTIGVCGTHGKTTTSLLISNIFNNVYGCNYFVGDGTGHATKDNKYFVIESDEFNKHFLAYQPTVAIITNVELDHVECYPGGIKEIRDTFQIFGNKADLVIACGDDENIRQIAWLKERTKAKILGGILPPVSLRNALFIKNEMAGMDIPDEIVERYKEDFTREEGELVGAEIAKELMKGFIPLRKSSGRVR